MTQMSAFAGETNDATRTRLVVLWKQNPENPLMSLVVKVDSLVREADRDQLLSYAYSADAQHERDFFDYLQKKGLIKDYHSRNLLTPLPVDSINMTPGDGRRIPLREIIDAINAQNGMPPLPSAKDMANISSANPLADEMKKDLLQDENKNGVAKSLIIQAQMMQAEVNKLLDKAFRLDSSMKKEWNRIQGVTETPAPVQQNSEPKAKVKKTEVKDTKPTERKTRKTKNKKVLLQEKTSAA